MASETPRQKRITGRVMHEFKHGELTSGRNGRGGKVKSRRQAIAIALEEAGASRYESGSRNRRNLRRTEKKEAQGRTGQQNARENRTSAPTGSAKAHARCPDETPAKQPRADGRRRPPAPENATGIPGKNFTRRRGGSGSKAGRR
jgi:hypothetical protein